MMRSKLHMVCSELIYIGIICYGFIDIKLIEIFAGSNIAFVKLIDVLILLPECVLIWM